MFLLRSQPKGARFASFGLGLCVFALMPTEIGYQDIASLLARQPGVAERWREPDCSPRPARSRSRRSQLRPSDRNLLAADRDLPAGEPGQSRHRHHGIGDAQSARRAAAALSSRRFSQGRPHAEGRSSHRRAACAGSGEHQGRPSARRRSRIPQRRMHWSKAPRPPKRRPRSSAHRSIRTAEPR